jgi:hypothetical protein
MAPWLYCGPKRCESAAEGMVILTTFKTELLVLPKILFSENGPWDADGLFNHHPTFSRIESFPDFLGCERSKSSFHLMSNLKLHDLDNHGDFSSYGPQLFLY